ncbi:Rec107p Ecym_7381 [Eremothecium cymbalariae DBVPG|uniref:Uncharacterized protein n=1 Tax=Eremothecium cymbalariae (strain CBS 270.75 / DBVPG 7215 / KCTC 17166 / NRRL Y-17582) TaxID=931890 RepID=G8JWJ2_ERECY|nr:hypothetical protein Ecym_7381 [Eremothecium cymbalariae DBVPG\
MSENEESMGLAPPTSATDMGSSPAKQLDETDKQILEWAGKLEMESIDLREKASSLLALLEQRCNEVHETQQSMVSWKNTIDDELKSFKEDVFQAIKDREESIVSQMKQVISDSVVSVQNANANKPLPPVVAASKLTPDMDKFSSKIIKSFETRQNKWFKEFQSAQQVFYNVMVQMDRFSEVLGNMSEELQHLSTRQVRVEEYLVRQQQQQEQIAKKPLPSTPPPSFVVTRKRSASPLHSRPPAPSRTKDKTLQTRYIIPWEDISDQEL